MSFRTTRKPSLVRRGRVWALVLGALVVSWLPGHGFGLANNRVSPQLCGRLYTPPLSPPWDFRYDKHFMALVEDAHFTPSVEALIKGKTANKVGPDIDYTLGRFPNHPRALIAVAKLYRRSSNTQAELLPRPAECYFERAVRFAPDDALVRVLYADFLNYLKYPEEAGFQLETAVKLAGDNLLTHRNIGLMYLQLGRVDKALEQAHRLEEGAANLPPGFNTLKGELVRRGLWVEPAAPPPAMSAASAPGSASGSAR